MLDVLDESRAPSAPMKIAIVADSHLAPDARAFNANWAAAGAFVRSVKADLTVHLGDITVDGLADPAQFAHALDLSADWPTPIRYLPGNHDIGDNPPGPNVASNHPLDGGRLADFRAAFGPDYWVVDSDGWRVIGLNAQLFGTESDDEREQWVWLAELIAQPQLLPVILMMHKPLFQHSPADEAPHHRYVPAIPRARLVDLLSHPSLRAVISGHTHQYRDWTVAGVRHIWVPSTAYYFPDEIQDRIGEKVVGVGLLELSLNAYRFHLVCPDGVERHSVLDHPVYPELAARARRA
jgi:3',5'-cyclic AMP phosphodiesterase CpdA